MNEGTWEVDVDAVQTAYEVGDEDANPDEGDAVRERLYRYGRSVEGPRPRNHENQRT